MKTVIVYDSVYGNTERIARAIGQAISGNVEVRRAGQVDPAELESADLLVVGSPTHGGRPTEAIQSLLERLGAPVREGAAAATFDTRFSWWWIKIFGFPAPRMAATLQEKGWRPAAPGEGFFVKGAKQGPLQEGEVERAAAWAKGLAGQNGG